MNDLQESIDHWNQLALDAERRMADGLLHPTVARAQAETYRRTAQALEIRRDTGVAVCACCHKPFGAPGRMS